MKEAYQKKLDDWNYYTWKKVELTGLCKRLEGGPYNERKCFQIQHRILGIPVWKSWVDGDSIKFFDAEKTKVYRCNCSDKEDDDFEVD